ncbi:MAG: hypothetical protein ACI4PG_05960, partial [Candidatus Ventricola sp.]
SRFLKHYRTNRNYSLLYYTPFICFPQPCGNYPQAGQNWGKTWGKLRKKADREGKPAAVSNMNYHRKAWFL